jgi:hypothetical protein
MKQILHPSRFRCGTRILMLVGRNKDGVEKQRVINRVSHSSIDFNKLWTELSLISKPGERIYASVNARNVKKASRIFKIKQLDSEYDQDPLEFYRKLEARWISSLMNVTAREDKYLLFDCDTAEDKVAVEKEVLPLVKDYYSYKTVNGLHYIVEPFNRSKLTESAKKILKENAFLLLSYRE